MALDFRFAIVVTFASLVLIAIGGFTIYRVHTGNIASALVNLVIMGLVLSVLVFALLSASSKIAGSLFALITTSGVLLSSFTLAGSALNWSYLVLWINFLLTERRVALVLNVSLIIFLTFDNTLFDQGVDTGIYVVTAGLVTAFGYIFAWRLADQRAQLEMIALRDPLTQAGNRRMMRRDLAAAALEHDQAGRSFTLILLDLDHFKALNDQHGHDAGDDALRDFVALLQNRIRASDGLYRFGGEEFVILLPDTGVEMAGKVALQLHESTSKKLVGPAGPLAYSAGVAVLQRRENPNGWLSRADQALYQAKQTGRNRVAFSELQTAAVQQPRSQGGG